MIQRSYLSACREYLKLSRNTVRHYFVLIVSSNLVIFAVLMSTIIAKDVFIPRPNPTACKRQGVYIWLGKL